MKKGFFFTASCFGLLLSPASAVWSQTIAGLASSARGPAGAASTAASAAAGGRAPTLVPGLDFKAGLAPVLTVAPQASLSAFAAALERAATPSRSKLARKDDPLRLASLDAVIGAALETDRARRTTIRTVLRAGVGGESALAGVDRLRAALSREDGRDAAALQSIKDLHARLNRNQAVGAVLASAFDQSRSAGFGDYVLVNSKGDPDALRKILMKDEFPRDAEVFTSEYSLVTNATWDASLSDKKLRASLIKAARGLDATLKPFQEIAREKSLKIWVGHLLYQDRKLYNAYSLVTKDGIAFTQRKKFLWKTEKAFISEPAHWEGLFKDYAILICSEASAFFNVAAYRAPNRIPEIRRAQPKLVVFPAHWVHNKSMVVDTARVIARPLWKKTYARGPVVKGVRPEGVPVFAVNYTEAAVVGPGPNRKHPSKVHASLKKPGWIQVIQGRVNVVKI
ncbi:MAG: hypothetical protein ACHQ49_03840 [Elusimicrobiota bacterium]